jgi:hypothetical protein
MTNHVGKGEDEVIFQNNKEFRLHHCMKQHILSKYL